MRPERKRIDALKRIRGQERKMHFEGGGTVSQWRGKSWTNTDRRKEASRKACRRPCEAE